MMLLHAAPSLRPGGGPAGYLYNLWTELKGLQGEQAVAVVAQEVSHERTAYSAASPVFLLLYKSRRWVPGCAMALALWLKAAHDSRAGLSQQWINRIKGADAVVFHDFRLFVRYLNTPRARFPHGSRPKGLLMLHSPTNPSSELAEFWRSGFSTGRATRLAERVWRKMELRAIREATALIAPTKHALDGYFRGSEEARHILSATKILELPSGVPPLIPEKPRTEVRQSIGCDHDDLAIGYVGRMVLDKGYDRFLAIADAVSKSGRRNIRMFGIGIGPLSNSTAAPGVLSELGWRTDMADVISALDIVIVPNRIAYFDLVILEAMSLGKTIYTTNIGGSKDLASGSVRYLSDGDTNEIASNFVSIIDDLILETPEYIRHIYNCEYSVSSFVQRHIALAKNLERLL